ncbi:chromobox protein homolog hpl-2-like [Brevipalpus obovatus]|uniref:chromobox protein homolog hpl-2-like n=1 Tax=Brevipalpus obovatus TaxID=246614 RepID=UPI003D9EF57D
MKLRKSVREGCQKENDPKPRGRKRCANVRKNVKSTVENAVLGKRIGPGGKTDYLLKWTGFSDDFNSWECAENLDENSLKEYRELDNVILINKSMPSQGDVYILRDVPKKIVETRKDAIDGEIEFLVEWCKESDLNWLPACIMKQSFPKLISDFYETKSHLPFI